MLLNDGSGVLTLTEEHLFLRTSCLDVADLNGDGIEEIAVYRAGTWLIDINGNRQLDAADMNFEMGETGDIPIVGDWDGDGIDEPGLYRESQVDQERVD